MLVGMWNGLMNHSMIIKWCKCSCQTNIHETILEIYSYCNRTHQQLGIEEDLKRKLPNLFQEHVMCAGSVTVKQGNFSNLKHKFWSQQCLSHIIITFYFKICTKSVVFLKMTWLFSYLCEAALAASFCEKY